MQFLIDSWLQILVAGIFVFIVSSVIHVALPIHKNDHKGLSGEDPILEAIRDQQIAPGSYIFPYASSMQECGTPEMIEKYNRGPVGFMTVFPNGPMAHGKPLFLWFIFSLIVGMATAYVASFSLAPDAGFTAIFRLTGTVAFLAYGFGVAPDSIWKGQPWGTTFKFIFDALLYGLATGATFAWLA